MILSIFATRYSVNNYFNFYFILNFEIKLKLLKYRSKKGFESSKRYLNIDLIDNKSKYWKFIYDYKITNIMLLEDRFNEYEVIYTNFSFKKNSCLSSGLYIEMKKA